MQGHFLEANTRILRLILIGRNRFIVFVSMFLSPSICPEPTVRFWGSFVFICTLFSWAAVVQERLVESKLFVFVFLYSGLCRHDSEVNVGQGES